jgi:hypothetical protein
MLLLLLLLLLLFIVVVWRSDWIIHFEIICLIDMDVNYFNWKFGSEDYSADVGITRTQNGEELLFARSAVVTHAKAFRFLSPFITLFDTHTHSLSFLLVLRTAKNE